MSSAGGTDPLATFLENLPADFNVPVAIVQHTVAGLAESLATWLAHHTRLRVRVPSHGVVVGPGEVAVAPDRQHLRILASGAASLVGGEPDDRHVPSGDVLLRSLAESFGARAAGVVLSGMGHDGAAGLEAIAAAGGWALVQDPDEASVDGMPSSALARVPRASVARAAKLGALIGQTDRDGGS